jgi:hypothetical protein
MMSERIMSRVKEGRGVAEGVDEEDDEGVDEEDDEEGDEKDTDEEDEEEGVDVGVDEGRQILYSASTCGLIRDKQHKQRGSRHNLCAACLGA